MSNELIVKKEIILNAPISKVWDALTNPEKTKAYMFNCKVVTDWKVGSQIIWKGAEDEKEYVKGNILNYEKEKLLEYITFDPNSETKDDPDNHLSVKMQLVPEGDRTLLKITQGDFSKVSNAQKRYDETILGWEYALGGLKNLIES
jgi:uncharacterized protein YndB with AHSA1/START domain